VRHAAEDEFGWSECGRCGLIRQGAEVAWAAEFQGPACEARFDFKLDPFVEDLVKFFAEIGNAIEARKLEAFQAILRKL